MSHNPKTPPRDNLAGGVLRLRVKRPGGGAGERKRQNRQIPAGTIPSIPTRPSPEARKQQRGRAPRSICSAENPLRGNRIDDATKPRVASKPAGFLRVGRNAKTPADATSSIVIWESPKSGPGSAEFHRPRKLRRSSSIDAEIGHPRLARPSASIETASSQSASMSD
jgi:hypothetical protein